MGAVLVLLAALCITAHSMTLEMKGQAFVDSINRNQPYYKAEVPKMPLEYYQSRLMDIKYSEKIADAKMAAALPVNVEIPTSFDAREKWPYCDSIKQIRDQANCGSCWAVSTASAMSDRLCIKSQGAKKTIISDTDILACCGAYCGGGCFGAWPLKAWEYTQSSGACSGGPYNAQNCCKPYPFHPCGQHVSQPYYGDCVGNQQTPACLASCQAGYPKSYNDDKTYASEAYYVQPSEQAIQVEIMTNGPVVATFDVYEDFIYYKSGVYMYYSGQSKGSHAVRIIGWGVENGMNYWLATNSWNSDWGDNGLFKILRGVNHCNIERQIVGGGMRV